MIVEDKNTTLIDKDIRLEPFRSQSDFDYLKRLWMEYPYNPYTGELAEQYFMKYGRYFWCVYVNNIKCGAIYLSYYSSKDMWTLQGFGDKVALKRVKDKLKHLREACEFVINFAFTMTDMLYSFHDIRNKQMIRVFKSIGFLFCERVEAKEGAFNLYLNRRILWLTR